MQNSEFYVEVISRQRSLYRVEAEDADMAERIAAARWQKGDPSDAQGYDGYELEGVRASPAPDDDRRFQDDEIILRFIREREQLLMKLGGSLTTLSPNDAVSAAQAARDLGLAGPESGSSAIARASEALERLCVRKQLVWFEKPRLRAGERGDIRLYCTPDYLEALSDSVSGALTERFAETA